MSFGSDVIFDISQWDKSMKRLMKLYPDRVKDAMIENALDVERYAKELAPKDEGSLEGSIEAKREVKVKGGYLGFPIEFTAEVHVGALDAPGNAAKYALHVHENMSPAGPVQPGPITRQKTSAAGPAGGKYLYRAMVFNAKKRTKNIADHLRGAMR